MMNASAIVGCVREIYSTQGSISLHAPEIGALERELVNRCLDTGFVSTAGAFVGEVERDLSAFTSSPHTVAVVNGTAALHVALTLVGVKPGDAVISQALTFVATTNAIRHTGANPEFVDVDETTLSICPQKLRSYLSARTGGPRVGACVLMHTFGHPGKIREIQAVCAEFGIPLIEDAAESLGSYYHEQHTGTFGHVGTLSFNGNKVATAGGGGALLFNDAALAKRGHHITTTAKRPHAWEFFHDEVAWNYRMPNLNAALLKAQLIKLPEVLKKKRAIAEAYRSFFKNTSLTFVDEPKDCRSNFWLNAVVCADRAERDRLLTETNVQGVQTRPIWTPMHHLPMYESCVRADLTVTDRLFNKVVCLPSGVIP